MTTGYHDARSIALTEAAKGMAREAVAAARDSAVDSPAWRFYHGIETAAQHVLHPEMASVRDDDGWLKAEDPAFRQGFLEASALLATAAASTPDPPRRLPLPNPPRLP